MRPGGLSSTPSIERQRRIEEAGRDRMKSFLYTVDTTKSFEAAVEAVERRVAEKNFRVVHTYDVAATPAERHFPRGPVKIIEVCNPRYAGEDLENDTDVESLLTCPIAVYTERGKTFIGTLRPSALITLCPRAGPAGIAVAVEKVVLQIVNAARA